MKTKLLLIISLLSSASAFADSSKPSAEDVNAQLKLVKGKCSEALHKDMQTLAEGAVFSSVSILIDSLNQWLTGKNSNLLSLEIKSFEHALNTSYLKNDLPKEMHKLFTLIHQLDETARGKIDPSLLELAEAYQETAPLTDSKEVETYCHKKL